MAQQTVKVTGVFEERGAKNGKPWTRTDVKDAGGNKYSTFDAGLGQKAQGIKGQTATLIYEEQHNGQYTNLILQGIELDSPVGSLTQETIAVNATHGEFLGQPAPIVAPSSKDESIARAVAFKGVVELVACDAVQADKIVEAVEYYTELLLTGKVNRCLRPFVGGVKSALRSANRPVSGH